MPAPGPAEPEVDRLIAEHTPLAWHLASRYNHRGEASEDLRQVALLALVRAARRYDPTRGVPFAGFAAPTILGELKRHFRDRTWATRVPRPLQERYLNAKATRDELEQHLGRAASIGEIAAQMRSSPEEVVEAMEAGRNFRASSIDGLQEAAEGHLPSVDGGYDQMLDRKLLADILPRLDAADLRLLKLRFEQELTQSVIGRELGVSQMQVSRTLDRVLARLRQEVLA